MEDAIEYTYIAPITGAMINVSKVGGGTVGQKYVGKWWYRYQLGDQVETGEDCETGTPWTHDQVAVMVTETFEQSD